MAPPARGEAALAEGRAYIAGPLLSRLYWGGLFFAVTDGPMLLDLAYAQRSFVPPSEPPVLIDLRSSAEFTHGHLAGACSMPLSELETRMFELPPPGEWPISLVGNANEVAAAQALLSPKGWTAAERALDGDDGAQLDDRSASAPAWRPNAFLWAVMRELAAMRDSEPARKDVSFLAAEGTAADLGCGSGRDAVFLSRELCGEASMPRWSVVGLDNHQGALERGRALAASAGARVRFVDTNLRKGGLESELGCRSSPLQLVHGCRFLDLPLLGRMGELLAPGGLIIWSHFLDNQIAPPFRASRRLLRGQMRELCGEDQGFEVLYDGEGELITRGKWVPAQFFVARATAGLG